MSNAAESPDLRAYPEVNVRRIDVARCRGVDVIVLHTNDAIFVLVQGHVLIFGLAGVVDILHAGHRYSVEL
jgi:hypothetical protein